MTALRAGLRPHSIGEVRMMRHAYKVRSRSGRDAQRALVLAERSARDGRRLTERTAPR